MIVASAGSGASTPRVTGNSRQLVINPSERYLNLAVRIAAGYGTVTSGFRTEAHNKQVGGVANSLHLFGRALDVQRRPGVTHRMVDTALRQGGLLLVESLDEIDHSHFAFKNTDPALLFRPQKIATSPTEPTRPSGPRVLADDHGLLLADDSRFAPVSGAGGK